MLRAHPLDPKGDKTLEVVECAPLSSFDALRHTGQTYYLGCDPKQPVDAYGIFAAAMESQNLAAVVRYQRSRKTRYAMLEVRGGVFVLSELHYTGAVRSALEVSHPQGEIDDAHLDLAKQLLSTMTVDEPTLDYPDEYVAKLREVIAAKKAGTPAAPAPAAPAARKALDLTAMLKASLETTKSNVVRIGHKKAA